MKPKKVASEAIKFVENYLKDRKGYEVINVSRNSGNFKDKAIHIGYDLLATTKNGRKIRIEVKGATRYGIPDPYITEFNKKTKKLVADFIYLVVFIKQEAPKLFKISRRNIPSDAIIIKNGWRIKSKLNKKSSLEKFSVKDI